VLQLIKEVAKNKEKVIMRQPDLHTTPPSDESV